MTEFNDDKPKTQKEKSFKEQILAELEEANRLRKQHDLELQQKEKEAEEFARKTAELMAEYEAEERKERQEVEIREEKRRLEEKTQTALAENQIETTVDDKEINDVLRNINQTFNPNGSDSEDNAENEQESYLVRATDGVGLLVFQIFLTTLQAMILKLLIPICKLKKMFRPKKALRIAQQRLIQTWRKTWEQNAKENATKQIVWHDALPCS